ncbi:MAG: Dabb family protein [Spirochaetales bacterium]|nr:Dabb family protein [Spirochaetales bacterium]
MVKHVVMWKFANPDHAQEAQNALEGMRGKVMTMESLETGLDFQNGPASYQLVLITTHANREQLDAYQADPDHCAVKEVLGDFPAERVVVDFEI